MSSEQQSSSPLSQHLSPVGVGAFAIGTSIGWGSLVVTNNTYLAQAGPLGSALGMNRHHRSGGVRRAGGIRA